jgi:hypothetical protein
VDEEPDSDEIGSISQSAEALRLTGGQERVLTRDDQAWIEAAEENARALVAATKVEPQFVSNDERKRLHDILDALLNEREYLEQWTCKIDELTVLEFYNLAVGPAEELHRNAARFLKYTIGGDIRACSILGAESPLESFALQARILTPAFSRPEPKSNNLERLWERGQEDFNNDEIIEDLIGICEGDAPRTFAIKPGKQGQHARPYRITRLRLRALRWEAKLKQLKHPAKARHRLISDSFNTDFGTIVKWKQLVIKVIGQSQFNREMSNLRITPYHFDVPLEYFAGEIKSDGAEYWAEKSNAPIPENFA